MHLLFLHLKPHFRINNRSHRGIYGHLTCRNHTDISSHHLYTYKVKGQGTILPQEKAFRTDSHSKWLILHPSDRKHSFLSDQKLSLLHAAFKQIDLWCSKKPCHKQIHRVLINLLRPSCLLDHSLFHNNDPVRNAHSLFLIVGDKHCGNSCFLLDPADLLPCLQAESCIQIGQRLIQKKNPWHLYKSPCDGNSLLLTTGKLTRLSVHQLLDLYKPCRFHGLLFHLILCQLILTLQVLQWKGDILQHAQMRIQCIILKYYTHTTVFRRQLRHIIFSKKDPSFCGLLQPADHKKGGTLATAGRAKEPYQFPVRYFKGKMIYRNHFPLSLFIPALKFFRQIL